MKKILLTAVLIGAMFSVSAYVVCVAAPLLGKNIKKTIVIGDYYNDLELMHAGGYAVAVANAPAEVKAAADFVTTCTCSEGAVGEFLYDMMEKANRI